MRTIKISNLKRFDYNINRIFTCILILMPIFNIYASILHDSIGIGDLCLIVLLPVVLFLQIYQKKKFVIQVYVVFLLIFYGTTIFSIFILQKMEFSAVDVITRCARDLLYALFFLYFVPIYFEREYGIRIYKSLVTFCSLIVMIQFFVYHTINKLWFPIFPNTTLLGGTNSDLIINARTIHALQNKFMPSAFFLERGDFSWYILPCVVICLFYLKGKSYIRAIFYSLAIIISTSASGIIGLVLIWFVWAMNIIISKRKNLKDYKILSYGIILGSSICGIIFVKTNALVIIFNRFREIDISLTGIYTSGYVRLIKGYDLYHKLSFEYKLFGIGAGNLQSFANSNYSLLEEFFQNGMLEYMNGISYILVSGGLISIIIFISCMGCYFNQGTQTIKVLIILLIAMLLISSFYGLAYYLLHMTFILSLKEEIKGTVRLQKRYCI